MLVRCPLHRLHGFIQVIVPDPPVEQAGVSNLFYGSFQSSLNLLGRFASSFLQPLHQNPGIARKNEDR